MKNKIKVIKRKCIICGKKITIRVYADGHYNNGHYFNKFKLPNGKGEYKNVGSTKIGNKKCNIVKWIGKEKEYEYWECNICFEEAQHLSWLEDKIWKLYGKKCKKLNKKCACCQAWDVYNTIVLNYKNEL